MLSALLGVEGPAEPDAEALVRESGEVVTYGALARVVARAAGQLRGAGACPGVSVALALADPVGLLISALAVWEAGAVCVPLDLRAGAAAAEEIAARAHARLVVRGCGADGELQLELRNGPAIDPRAALLLFTAGSSGKPKGVLLSAAGLRANVMAILGYLPIGDHPRTALTLPLAYSYALVGQALTTLRAGGALLILSELGYPALQLASMARLRASGLSSVPAALRLLARLVAEGAEPPPLGYLASAGAPLDAPTAGALRTAFPRARLFNQYGLTEASPRVAAIEDRDPAFAKGAAGRALPGLTVWTEGAQGDIFVKGPSVMLGYLDDPEATAHALSAEGALRTGDVGFVDESGALHVRGRGDGVVKVAGERVSLDEIAEVLRAAGARDAAVVALPDQALGARLIAFAEVPEAGLAALRRAVREQLGPAKRPAQIVAVHSLPRLPSGKADLVQLRALAAL